MTSAKYHCHFERLVNYLYQRNIRDFNIKNWTEYFNLVEECSNPRWTKEVKKKRRCVATQYYRQYQNRIERAVQWLRENREDDESDEDSDAESRASDDSDTVS